ncbi:phospholipase D family protein [Nocardia aurea]|uniref:Phospholipase D family protein n=1 Tax=Nocardia aurea TaxID=2144174 RepID=A0ABV3G525_9NOCA
MHSDDHIWRQIEMLLSDAHDSVILVAPFVKRAVFNSLLAAIPASVQRIDCITRWTPSEVAAGVSDPEILEIAQVDPRVSVWLCATLHAKVYIADARCLVGSANLTAKATGRTPGPNIEILIETHTTHPEVDRVMRALDNRKSAATSQLAALIRAQANLLTDGINTPAMEPHLWYPTTRRPEDMFRFYSGKDNFSPAVEDGMLKDLAVLDLPAGLRESEFRSAVENQLHSIPELSELLKGESITNSDLERAIEARSSLDNHKSRRIAENIAAWLKHFGDYYTQVGSWELRHGRELSR